MSEKWNLLGFVDSSQYRTAVLEALDEKPRKPSTIAERTDIEITHVSRALREMRERDLVELLVPESRRKGRIYGLTDDGRDIWSEYEDRLVTDGGRDDE
jgi:DNA-binding MarR family transcriptional regulator